MYTCTTQSLQTIANGSKYLRQIRHISKHITIKKKEPGNR